MRSFGDPIDRRQHAFAHLSFVGAHCELHFHFVRNDVVLRAAVDRTDRDDDWIERIIFAAGDGLPAR